jgi:hypothetical protein
MQFRGFWSLVCAWVGAQLGLHVRLSLPLCWGGWLLSVGCVRLCAVARQGGVWVQLPCFFWSGRWAPPEIGLCGISLTWCGLCLGFCFCFGLLWLLLCLGPPAVGLTRVLCVWPASDRLPLLFKKKTALGSKPSTGLARRSTFHITQLQGLPAAAHLKPTS